MICNADGEDLVEGRETLEACRDACVAKQGCEFFNYGWVKNNNMPDGVKWLCHGRPIADAVWIYVSVLPPESVCARGEIT